MSLRHFFNYTTEPTCKTKKIHSQRFIRAAFLPYNDAEIDLTDFTTALEALTADRFADGETAGQEEISLTLHLDNENFPTVNIRITRYDGELCLVEVDGESVSLVSRSEAMDLVEAVQTIVLGQNS